MALRAAIHLLAISSSFRTINSAFLTSGHCHYRLSDRVLFQAPSRTAFPDTLTEAHFTVTRHRRLAPCRCVGLCAACDAWLDDRLRHAVFSPASAAIAKLVANSANGLPTPPLPLPLLLSVPHSRCDSGAWNCRKRRVLLPSPGGARAIHWQWSCSRLSALKYPLPAR